MESGKPKRTSRSNKRSVEYVWRCRSDIGEVEDVKKKFNLGYRMVSVLVSVLALMLVLVSVLVSVLRLGCFRILALADEFCGLGLGLTVFPSPQPQLPSGGD